MDQAIADRIIDLTRKWQNKVEWTIAHEAAESFTENRRKSDRDFATAKKMQSEGQQGEMLELFQHGSERHGELSELDHKQVVTAHRELFELTNLLREYAPKLLQLVPIINFFFDDLKSDDVDRWVRQMREIEAEFLVLVNEFIAKSDEPQSEGNAGTETTERETVEQRALAVLVVHPDWTVKKIASEIGATREYLSSKDCPKFKAARAAIRASNLPAGTKTKTGEMEAIGDDDLDFDEMDERMKPKR